MAGVNIYKYLSFQTLIGKTIGLFCGLIAGINEPQLGLSIGKEGPFVHLAAGVANKLSKLKLFKKIDNNQAVKKQMLAAAVAAGVASTFGAPMGGELNLILRCAFFNRSDCYLLHGEQFMESFFLCDLECGCLQASPRSAACLTIHRNYDQ